MVPAIIRLTDVKLIMNMATFRLSKPSCIRPVNNGPNDVPTEVLIMVNANATANSLGRICGRWNGTVTRIGKKAQATPLKNDKMNRVGSDPVKIIPMLVQIIRIPRP